MDKLTRLRNWTTAYRAVCPEATSREAREWMEATEDHIGADTAAELAGKGYRPDVVAARIEAAYDQGDERDVERVVDGMLYGPDAA